MELMKSTNQHQDSLRQLSFNHQGSIQTTVDISSLRKTRRMRINYEHRHFPGEVKRRLSADDVILNRYKRIPLPKYSQEKERTIVLRSNKKQRITEDNHSQSTMTFPPIGHTNGQGSVINNDKSNISGSDSVVNSQNTKDDFSLRNELILPLVNNSESPSPSSNGFPSSSRGKDREQLRVSGWSKEMNGYDHGDDDSEDDEDEIDDNVDDVNEKSMSRISGEYKEFRDNLAKNRVLTSPDYDTDLDLSEKSSDSEDLIDPNGRKAKKKLSKSLTTYYRSCAKCQLTPNKSFARQCGKGSVDIRHRMLTYKDVKPIAIALVDDQRTSFLDISMNYLGPVGADCLAQMLLQNNTIVELNVSSTFPQRVGLESLVHSLGYNRTLRRLYLDNNELQPSDGEVLARLIESAASVTELHLGNNNLGFEGTKRIAKALSLSKGSLSVLNLQYNNIRTDTAVQLAVAIGRNTTLQRLDVSWNGFGEAGCKALATALQRNNTLRHLDLTCNRLGLKSLASLIQGITKNKGLLCARVSSNPLTTEGVKAILSALLSTKTWTLTELDVRGIPVDHEFLVLKDRLEQARPIRVLHEEFVSLGTSDMSRMSTGTFLDNYNPVMVMFEFMKKDNLRVIDLFQFFDIRKRDKLSKADLSAGFKTLSIPFTKYQINVIAKSLDTDKDGFVSLDEMVKGYTKNDKTVKTRRIKASMNKTTDRGLENLWAYLKTLITKRKDDNAKKNAINAQARRNNFLPVTDTTKGNLSPGTDGRKGSACQEPADRKGSVWQEQAGRKGSVWQEAAGRNGSVWQEPAGRKDSAVQGRETSVDAASPAGLKFDTRPDTNGQDIVKKKMSVSIHLNRKVSTPVHEEKQVDA